MWINKLNEFPKQKFILPSINLLYFRFDLSNSCRSFEAKNYKDYTLSFNLFSLAL